MLSVREKFGNATHNSIDRVQVHVYKEYNLGLNLNYTKTRRWARLYHRHVQTIYSTDNNGDTRGKAGEASGTMAWWGTERRRQWRCSGPSWSRSSEAG